MCMGNDSIPLEKRITFMGLPLTGLLYRALSQAGNKNESKANTLGNSSRKKLVLSISMKHEFICSPVTNPPGNRLFLGKSLSKG